MPKPKAPKIESFVANPNSITLGQSVTLSWGVSGQVAALTIDHQIGNVMGLSTKVVTPANSGTFTLTASNRWGTAKKSVNVQVVVAPPIPPPEPPPTPIPWPPITLSRLLVMPVIFSDQANDPKCFSRADMEKFFFDLSNPSSVKRWFNDVSYGAFSFEGDVTDWVKLPIPLPANPNQFTYAEYSIADSMASTLGYDLTSYKYIFYIENNPYDYSKCFGWGQGLSAYPRRAFITNPNLGRVCHELGHTLDLQHSSSLNCGSTIFNPDWKISCTVGQLADMYCTMGGAREALHYNAVQKTRLGWITPIEVSNGEFAIAPYEPKNNSQVIQVLAGIYDNLPYHYFVEYRTIPNQTILIHFAVIKDPNSLSMPPCYLLNMAPGVIGNEGLKVGQTFTDPNGTSITLVSMTTTGSTINVRT